MPRPTPELSLFGNLPMPRMTAGIDEAGRGPLAGDVFAAAVILDPGRRINGLADSKILTASKRESLALRIREKALAWSIASASVKEIDTLNILGATMLAMKRAFDGLAVRCAEQQAELVLIDGNRVPHGLSVPCHAVVRGDALHACISAASILAKTARDAQLRELHAQYPEYGFDQHKGYGTALHLSRLKTYGPCPIHRTTFAPVKSLLSMTAAERFLG